MSRRCHNPTETAQLDASQRQYTDMDECGLLTQVKECVCRSWRTTQWTAMDALGRVGAAFGTEGRRFESCRGHHLSSRNACPCKIHATDYRRGSDPMNILSTSIGGPLACQYLCPPSPTPAARARWIRAIDPKLVQTQKRPPIYEPMAFLLHCHCTMTQIISSYD